MQQDTPSYIRLSTTYPAPLIYADYSDEDSAPNPAGKSKYDAHKEVEIKNRSKLYYEKEINDYLHDGQKYAESISAKSAPADRRNMDHRFNDYLALNVPEVENGELIDVLDAILERQQKKADKISFEKIAPEPLPQISLLNVPQTAQSAEPVLERTFDNTEMTYPKPKKKKNKKKKKTTVESINLDELEKSPGKTLDIPANPISLEVSPQRSIFTNIVECFKNGFYMVNKVQEDKEQLTSENSDIHENVDQSRKEDKKLPTEIESNENELDDAECIQQDISSQTNNQQLEFTLETQLNPNPNLQASIINTYAKTLTAKQQHSTVSQGTSTTNKSNDNPNSLQNGKTKPSVNNNHLNSSTKSNTAKESLERCNGEGEIWEIQCPSSVQYQYGFILYQLTSTLQYHLISCNTVR